MKKSNTINNFILLSFIILSTFNYSVNGLNKEITTTKDNHIEIQKSTNIAIKIRLDDENNKKISKKYIKEEIKRRKKYHKALISNYNEAFEERYLDLIKDNSKKLTNLRELLQS